VAIRTLNAKKKKKKGFRAHGGNMSTENPFTRVTLRKKKTKGGKRRRRKKVDRKNKLKRGKTPVRTGKRGKRPARHGEDNQSRTKKGGEVVKWVENWRRKTAETTTRGVGKKNNGPGDLKRGRQKPGLGDKRDPCFRFRQRTGGQATEAKRKGHRCRGA